MTEALRFDAWEKVSGKAVFAGDLKLPGMLFVSILRSEVAHARIRGVDVSAALELPGVKAVITGSIEATFGYRTMSWDLTIPGIMALGLARAS